MGRYLTVGQLINQVSVNLGLPVVADPVASNDNVSKQMVGLLTEAGRDIVLKHEWPQLVAEEVVTTVAGQVDYTLPSDFLHVIAQSGWNRTTRFPLGGPLSVQEWQYLKAAVVGVTFNVLFRMTPTTMRLFPTPPVGFTLAYEYQSRSWLSLAGTTPATLTASSTVLTGGVAVHDASVNVVVSDALWAQILPYLGHAVSVTLGRSDEAEVETFTGVLTGSFSSGTRSLSVVFNGAEMAAYDHAAGTYVEMVITTGATSAPTGLPEADAPVSSGDLILFEPVLMHKALKLAFRQAKGFDTTIDQAEYEACLTMVAGRSDGAPRLSLNGNRIRDRFLDGLNVPITGMGGQGFGS